MATNLIKVDVVKVVCFGVFSDFFQRLSLTFQIKESDVFLNIVDQQSLCCYCYIPKLSSLRKDCSINLNISDHVRLLWEHT